MNRRSFLQSFSILAAATTYGRTWKVVAGIAVPPVSRPWVPPAYEDAPFQIGFLMMDGQYHPHYPNFPFDTRPVRACHNPQGELYLVFPR